MTCDIRIVISRCEETMWYALLLPIQRWTFNNIVKYILIIAWCMSAIVHTYNAGINLNGIMMGLGLFFARKHYCNNMGGKNGVGHFRVGGGKFQNPWKCLIKQYNTRNDIIIKQYKTWIISKFEILIRMLKYWQKWEK